MGRRRAYIVIHLVHRSVSVFGKLPRATLPNIKKAIKAGLPRTYLATEHGCTCEGEKIKDIILKRKLARRVFNRGSTLHIEVG